ncbi:MAG: hypothetical protein N3F05_03155 [Candidatus Diapherotrites archaeon]|nr:hypothetical protein [Candidatus Diapherotrites archaeon]
MHIVKLYKVDIGVNEDYPIVSSQSIFAALLNAMPNLAEKLILDDRFAVSSMFPFSGNKIYLPIVNAKILMKDKNDELNKKIKSKKLLVVDAFKEGLNEKYLDDKPEDVFLIKNAHNSVPRTTKMAGETKLFFSYRIKSTKKSGLWFSYSPQFKSIIEKALLEMKYFGFGRDKTTSSQPFEDFEFHEIEDDGDFFINLALYSPTKDELKQFLEKSKEDEFFGPNYVLVQYAGWTEVSDGHFTVNMEKPAKYYFKEGSIFPSLGKTSYGRRGPYAELEGNFKHKIYWNGITPIYKFKRG